jgi:hypothetical protein
MDDPERVEKALRHYDNMRKASAAYYDRKRQMKKDDGTYKGKGRPKKPSAIFVQGPVGVMETYNPPIGPNGPTGVNGN